MEIQDWAELEIILTSGKTLSIHGDHEQLMQAVEEIQTGPNTITGRKAVPLIVKACIGFIGTEVAGWSLKEDPQFVYAMPLPEGTEMPESISEAEQAEIGVYISSEVENTLIGKE